MISKLALLRRQHKYLLQSTNLMRQPHLVRMFSSSSADYHQFEENIFYSPVHKINFQGGKATIFHQEHTPEKPKYLPWEIKEATVKNGMGIAMMLVVEFLLNTPAWFYSAGSLFFALNWVNTVYQYMANAVIKVELLEDGKSVTITYKGGSSQTVQIKNIYKKKHEKDLV